MILYLSVISNKIKSKTKKLTKKNLLLTVWENLFHFQKKSTFAAAIHYAIFLRLTIWSANNT